MDDLLHHALGYARRGWHVFPCSQHNKAPLVPCDKDQHGDDIPKTGGLYKATTDEAQVTEWWSKHPGAMIGVRMGACSGVWSIDPDAPKRQGEADGRVAWAELTSKHGDVHTHTHLTPGGGKHLVFEWNPDRPVTNKEGALKGRGINVRGEGGYIIAPPSRRADGRSYEIEEALDFFNFAKAPEWLYQLIEARNQQGEPSREEQHSSTLLSQRHRAYAEAALRNEAQAVATAPAGTRNNQLNISACKLGGLVAASVLSEGEVIGALYDGAGACGLVKQDGQRSVMATINSGLRKGRERPREIRDDEPWNAGKSTGGSSYSGDVDAATIKGPIIDATPFVYRDPALIPRRQWLYGKHLIRKFGSATFAHPGVGKSALVLGEALALASGRDLLGIRPQERCRVWYWNGEDPLEETERRIAAACLHYSLGAADLEGWLFSDSGRDQEIVLAHQTKDRALIAEPVVAALKATIDKHQIDVLIIDPFISSHRVTESDNNAIDIVAKKWTEIADKMNIAIELVHHCRKTGGGEVMVEDGRGAISLLAAVRSARVLNPMTDDQAAKRSIASRRRYFRVDDGKPNLAPPGDENGDWYYLEFVSLGNGDPQNLIDTADNVGVVTTWELPDPLDGVTADDFEKCASAIRSKGNCRENAQSSDWVGIAIAKALGLNLTKNVDKARVKLIIKSWISNGALEVVERPDSKRMPKKFVEVSDEP